jgi:rhodanese-related sulfurtransferase
VRQWTASQLRERLERADGKPLLLDVREPWEFRICHIEGSTLIPMREIPAAAHGLDPDR